MIDAWIECTLFAHIWSDGPLCSNRISKMFDGKVHMHFHFLESLTDVYLISETANILMLLNN